MNIINFFNSSFVQKKFCLKDFSEAELKISENNLEKTKFNKNLELHLSNQLEKKSR